MPIEKDPQRKVHRDAFVQANIPLLERCCGNPGGVQESDLVELISRARVHFNYSPNTRDMDIKRAVLTAYRRHKAPGRSHVQREN